MTSQHRRIGGKIREEGMMENVFHVAPAADVSDLDFEQFMRDEVFPLIHTGPTRVGEITGVRLYRLGTEDEGGVDRASRTERYVWLFEWGGLEQAMNVLAGPAIEKVRNAGAAVRGAGDWKLVHARQQPTETVEG
jgi:hypothetical protein